MATQRRPYFKIAATAKAAGIPHSLWTVSGHPGAGATPATLTLPSDWLANR